MAIEARSTKVVPTDEQTTTADATTEQTTTETQATEEARGEAVERFMDTAYVGVRRDVEENKNSKVWASRDDTSEILYRTAEHVSPSLIDGYSVDWFYPTQMHGRDVNIIQFTCNADTDGDR